MGDDGASVDSLISSVLNVTNELFRSAHAWLEGYCIVVKMRKENKAKKIIATSSIFYEKCDIPITA